MKKSYQHTIDFLFPIALFFVFSATSLVILLLAANIYKNIVTLSDSSFTQTTALSYVREKIHQTEGNQLENIYLTEFDGYQALALVQSFEDQKYVTYIYETNGELKELFIQDGVNAFASTGTTILTVKDFQIEELGEGIFRFTCITLKGDSHSIIVSLNCP